MLFKPLISYRLVLIQQRRTKLDFAQAMKWPVDEAYLKTE